MFLNPTPSSSVPQSQIKMELASMAASSNFSILNPRCPFRTQIASQLHASIQNSTTPVQNRKEDSFEVTMPTMSEILESSRSQKLDLKLQILGPFFRITAKSLETEEELGRAEGFIRVWLRRRILHLDSIRLRRETIGMEKSIFGIGLFIGAVAIRHGYDCGCNINDSDKYHHKLVRFYSRIGFKAVYEVTGSTFGDLAHMLVWGGVGTRMDAKVEALLIKWCSRFKSR